jgi:hypothetical protein
MTDQERNQILKMIEDGKITPEEGLKLMQALDQALPEDESPAPQVNASKGSEPGTQSEKSGMDLDPRIARVKSTARRLWQVPLWIGVAIIVLSALGMYGIMQGPGMNFWFYCLTAPLLLGVLIIAAAAGSRKARWIFVDVQQKPGDRPERIFLGFPLPLKFAAWFLRTFKHTIPELDKKLGKTSTDEIIEAVEGGLDGDTPLIVNVDEGDDGERVKVYIG